MLCCYIAKVEHSDRTARLAVFKSSEAHRLLIVSTTAGGQGLDMSAASVTKQTITLTKLTNFQH
jgi:hypothetical protein